METIILSNGTIAVPAPPPLEKSAAADFQSAAADSSELIDDKALMELLSKVRQLMIQLETKPGTSELEKVFLVISLMEKLSFSLKDTPDHKRSSIFHVIKNLSHLMVILAGNPLTIDEAECKLKSASSHKYINYCDEDLRKAEEYLAYFFGKLKSLHVQLMALSDNVSSHAADVILTSATVEQVEKAKAVDVVVGKILASLIPAYEAFLVSPNKDTCGNLLEAAVRAEHEGKYRVFIDPIINGNISYIAFCKVFSDYQKMLDDYQYLSKWLIDALDKREKAYTNRNVSILQAAYRQIDAEQAIAAFKCPETDFALV